MPVGTTFDSNLTRDQLCTAALRKLGILKGASVPTTAQLNNAVEALNLISCDELKFDGSLIELLAEAKLIKIGQKGGGIRVMQSIAKAAAEGYKNSGEGLEEAAE